MEAELVVEYGDPLTKIMQSAKFQKSDAIVMGTHNRIGLIRVVMGSIAEKIIRYSSVPVLIVKHDSHELIQKIEYEYDLHKRNYCKNQVES